MLESLSLHAVGPSPDLTIEFAPRLTALTGDNGLGKSFLLDCAWWALTRTWASKPALPRTDATTEPTISFATRDGSGKSTTGTSSYDLAGESWLTTSHGTRKSGVVIYARVNGDFSVWDAARALKTDGVKYTGAFHFRQHDVWEGLTLGARKPSEGLIRDWVGWQKAREPEFDHLFSAMRTLSVPGEPIEPAPPARVSRGDGFDTPHVRTQYGIVPLTHASAGLRRIAGLAYILVWAWREHREAARLLKQRPTADIVVLLDEPETHLHPRWQRLIVPGVLSAVHELTGAQSGRDPQLVFSTHSPLVLASLEPIFDVQHDALCELVLTSEADHDPTIEARRAPWAKQGDVLGWLVSDTFGLRQARSLDAERAIEAAEAYMRGVERKHLPKGLATQAQIDAELHRLLPGHDPFWPRWLVKTNQVGSRKRRGPRRATGSDS